MLRSASCLLGGLLLLVSVGCDRSAHEGSPAGELRIAVIPKGTTHEFWKSVHAGAVKAEREFDNVDVVFKGPEREDNREQQVALVQSFITADVDALVLAPLDENALLTPVRQAGQAGIPVVIIDSGLAGEVGSDFVSFVATDNYKGGQLAGARILALLPEGGRVLLLRYQEGSASTARREQGFIDALAEAENIELIDPRTYAGPTAGTAQQAAENLLTAHGDVDGVFCPNESSTVGMLLALRARNLASEVAFVGFDSSTPLKAALISGHLDGLVVQNPFAMGYEGVRAAVGHLKGEGVEPRIDTGVVLVTPANMKEPQVKALLYPELDKYLQ